jgi:hypothetical protein
MDFLGYGLEKRKGETKMKRLLPVSLVVVFAIVLGMTLLFTTGGNLKAAEVKSVDWSGNPEDINMAAFLCDPERMDEALENEKTRICVIDAVGQDEEARKMIMQRMLKSPKVRGQIMDSIATTPALRAEMEAKLATTK